MEPDQNTDRYKLLNSSYNFFFDEIEDRHIAYPDEAYLPYILLPKDKALAQIEDYIAALRAYRVTPETARNDKVRLAHRLVLPFLDEQSELLKKHQITTVYLGGSLIYDDPRNCDVDLRFFTLAKPVYIDEISNTFESLNPSLKANFGDRSTIETPIISIANINSVINMLENDSFKTQYHKLPFSIYDADFILSNASYPLTALPIWEEDHNRAEDLTSKTLEMLSNSTMLRSFVLDSLKETLDERVKRRKH